MKITAFSTLVAFSLLVSAQAAFSNVPSDNIALDLSDQPMTLLQQRAIELAKLQYSEDSVRDSVSKSLDKSLQASMRKDPTYADLETAYPGLIDVSIAAIKPAMLQAYSDKLPMLWQNLADLYADTFTVSDIDKILVFLKSPAGMRFTQSVRQNMNVDASVDAARKAGEAESTVNAALKKDQLAAIRKANAAISASDKIAIFRFENSATGVKLGVILPQMQAIQTQWDFYFTDAQRKNFAELRAKAVSDFMDQSDADKTSSTP